MSDSIFYFEPDLVENREYSPAWSTTVTQFESGTSQWQSEWSRQIYDFKFMYRGYFDDLRWNPIEAFFNTHKGRGDSFLLPSWRAETKLTTAYTSGVGLDLVSTVFFSDITDKPGNLLHIKHINGSPEEVKQVAEVVNGTHLHLASGFANTYPVNSVVQIAYRVRFSMDKMPPLKYIGYDIYEVELTMQEDV
jgi:hypothetical protein